MTTMTKSLHTITATLRVAEHIDATDRRHYGASQFLDATLLASYALKILGYYISDYSADDPTIVKIVAGCSKILKRA
jgi:hypothetical protein